MKTKPATAALRRKARVKAKLADAVKFLRAVDDKLGKAADDFDGDAKSCCDLFEVKHSRHIVRFLADMLDEGHEPSLAPRVFDCITSHGNTQDLNTPHLEGVIVGLSMAEDTLESALEMAGQFDDDDSEIDSAYQTPYAIWGIVKGTAANLGCSALGFDVEAAIHDILLTGAESLAAA